MKSISLLLLLSFGAAAQAPMMNFNTSSDNAMVCNATDKEQPNLDDNSQFFGRTQFMVLFKAMGCAAVHLGQAEVCNQQIIQAGQCASYHFRGGTSHPSAQICLPHAHGALEDWNCGTGGRHGHLVFSLSNTLRADVDHLQYYTIYDVKEDYKHVVGNVDVHRH